MQPTKKFIIVELLSILSSLPLLGFGLLLFFTVADPIIYLIYGFSSILLCFPAFLKILNLLNRQKSFLIKLRGSLILTIINIILLAGQLFNYLMSLIGCTNYYFPGCENYLTQIAFFAIAITLNLPSVIYYLKFTNKLRHEPLLIIVFVISIIFGGGTFAIKPIINKVQEKQNVTIAEENKKRAELQKENEKQPKIEKNGNLPEKFPKDFPIYPNSKLSESLENKESVWTVFESADSNSEISNYYITQLKKNGWQITNEFEWGFEIIFTATRNNEKAEFQLLRFPEDKNTRIALTIYLN